MVSLNGEESGGRGVGLRHCLSRDSQGRDLTWIRLSEPLPRVSVSQVGSGWRVSVTTRRETFPMINVPQFTSSDPDISSHHGKPHTSLSGFSLYTQIQYDRLKFI